MNRRLQLVLSVCAALAVLVLDRVSKVYALTFFTEPISINRFLTFDLAFNRGISCGFFHFTGSIGFFIVSVLVSVVLAIIVVWTWRVYHRGGLIIGQLLVIAGGASNILDRLLYAGVIDFISVSLNGWHWALFNIADVAINIGVLILLSQSLLTKHHD